MVKLGQFTMSSMIFVESTGPGHLAIGSVQHVEEIVHVATLVKSLEKIVKASRQLGYDGGHYLAVVHLGPRQSKLVKVDSDLKEETCHAANV